MHTRCHLLACSGTLDAPPCGRVWRSRPNHPCFLETLAKRVAGVTADGAAREEALSTSWPTATPSWRHSCSLDRPGLEVREMTSLGLLLLRLVMGGLLVGRCAKGLRNVRRARSGRDGTDVREGRPAPRPVV